MSNDNLKAQVEEYNEDFIDSEEKELINDLYTALQEAEAMLKTMSEDADVVIADWKLSQELNKVAVEALEYMQPINYVTKEVVEKALAKIEAMGEA